MLTESCEKVANIFVCKACDYRTERKSSFDKHLTTAKHAQLTSVNTPSAKSCVLEFNNASKYVCKFCEKEYKSRIGLWKHKKIGCKIVHETLSNMIEKELTDKDLIMLLLNENKDLKTMMIEQQNAVLELCKNGINNTNNTNNNNTINSHNKTFNLQFFLNETCKDAMNISDFVQSIQIQLSDLEKVGEIGYIDGISNIILKNLKGLDITQRPIHCTDKKREVLYVKDEDKWEKEDQENKKIRRAIKQIAHKNSRLLKQFREKYPDYSKSVSKCSDTYNKLVIEAMGGRGNNDTEKENKIIKNIAKEVAIEK